MENNNNQYKKMYKNKDFITTTDFFIDQYITNKQIMSLHYAMLELDVIHSINNCATELGESCKQTLDSLKQTHKEYNIEITDTKDIEPLIGSYFVGEYKNNDDKSLEYDIVPIFLTENGDFKDYRLQFDYWVDYRKNTDNKEKITKKSIISNNNSYKVSTWIFKLEEKLREININETEKRTKLTNYLTKLQDAKKKFLKRTHYEFKYKNDFDSAGGFKNEGAPYIYKQELFDKYLEKIKKVYNGDFKLKYEHKEKIKSQIFDIDILMKTLDIVETFSDENKKKLRDHNNYKLLVGISEYTRNHDSRYIFLDKKGRFVDQYGNYFWPLYETTLRKIDVDGEQQKPFSVYLFEKIKTSNEANEKFKDELIAYNYYFHHPENKAWDESSTAITKTLKSIFFYLSIGIIIDAGLLYESYLQEVAKAAHQQAWLASHHAKYESDISSLQSNKDYLVTNTRLTHSQVTKMKDFISHYNNVNQASIQTNEILASSINSLSGSGFYHSIFQHHHEECMKSIHQLLADYPGFTFPQPGTMPNATPCQEAFLVHWQTQYNARYWGGTPGSHFKESIGDTNGWAWHGNANASKHVFDHISKHVSGHSAHSAVVHDKSIFDKYSNNVLSNVALSGTHTTVSASNSLHNTETTSLAVTSSLGVWSDKNSDHRKKSDKEVGEISLTAEIEKIKLEIADNKFFISLFEENKNKVEKQQPIIDDIQEKKEKISQLTQTLGMLNKLKKTINKK
jgi:hypothetical protein